MHSSWQKILGNAHRLEKIGDYLKAAEEYSQALSQAKQIFQEYPECLIETMEGYIQVCEIGQQYDEIENTYKEILSFIKSYGPDYATFHEQIVRKLYAFYLSHSQYDKLDTLTGADEILANENQLNQDAYTDEIQSCRRISKPTKKSPTPTKKENVTENDNISCSVYSEGSVPAGGNILLQVFAHLPDKKGEATAMASMFDDEASIRGTTHLNTHVKRGTDLCFHLEIDEIIKVDKVAKHLKWQGETCSVQFGLSFPNNYPIGSFIGKIIITMESIPIGHILFKLKVLEANRTAFKKATTIFSKFGSFISKSKTDKSSTRIKSQGEMKRYKYAFISYASPDQDEVLRRVQMLGLAGINYFQDIMSLDPGVRWEKELYKHIDRSDVFFLFWSSAAKDSKWVLQEVKYAISCQGATHNGIPEIIPVIIEGPPVPKPPQMLSHIHFNDSMVYFIKS